ncbi:MOSC domain-containing protein [Nocardioides sp. CPCC 205120]|uniref:MOSC domain-containing protein n=1 Tax=Nocardioides sp. CPCC 205120 TaxID=3406462 RepID=UPI003B50F9EC
MALTLTSIHRFPAKSMRGEALDSCAVEPWGLAGDRRWMLVEGEGPTAGTFLSARRDARLVLLEPTLLDGALRLAAPGVEGAPEPLVVPEPDGTEQVQLTLWSSSLTGAAAGAAADAWASEYVGRPVRLLHLDDPTRRATNPGFSRPGDRVSFADGYPLLVTTEASLAALHAAMAEAGSDEPPVPMDRFRPNLVVDGDEPWAEDDWRRIQVGDVVFRAVKGCARCAITTVDATTGSRGKEPLRTLARVRRFDTGVWFGVNLVPDVEPAADRAAAYPVVRVGDPVKVLDAVTSGRGPLRAAPARVS